MRTVSVIVLLAVAGEASAQGKMLVQSGTAAKIDAKKGFLWLEGQPENNPWKVGKAKVEGEVKELADIRTKFHRVTVTYDRQAAKVIALKVENPPPPPPPIMPQKFTVGDKGEFRNETSGNLFEPQIVSVVGPEKMILNLGTVGNFVVVGVPTKNFADDQRITLQGVYECTGTEKIGITTYRVVRPAK